MRSVVDGQEGSSIYNSSIGQFPYKFYMTELQCKWKSISKDDSRINRRFSLKKELPERFTPHRMRSTSPDTFFNLERSQVLSNSVERTNLNMTREELSLEKSRVVSRMSTNREEEVSKLKRESQQLSSVKIGATSSSIGQLKAIDKVGKSNQMITDIKKEFMAFKQNVLQQLERQKKMVNELVQNIVLTLEFELGKLGRIQQTSQQQSLQKDEGNSNTFEQLKNNLYKPEFMTPQKNSSVFPSIKPLNPKKLPVATTEREDPVKPPEEAYDMGEFVGSIENIQRRINEMDLIFSSLEGEEYSGTNV